MTYIINVAKVTAAFPKGRYLFSTREMSHFECFTAYNELIRKFPEPDYVISIIKWEKIGTEVKPEDFQ